MKEFRLLYFLLNETLSFFLSAVIEKIEKQNLARIQFLCLYEHFKEVELDQFFLNVIVDNPFVLFFEKIHTCTIVYKYYKKGLQKSITI